MKLIAHAVTALALLAFATPALPCDKHKTTTTASSASEGSTIVATKSGTAEKDKKAKDKAETKPATAEN
jgi:hypothetical protein